MPRVPVPFVGDAYADDVLMFAAQETVNWLPEKSERSGTLSETILKTPDGLSQFAQVGNGTIRGSVMMAGVLYVVADTMLYSIATDGSATALGTIEGSGRVGISENGYQVIVVNGAKGWTYNKNTAVFAQITDPDFPGADTCAFLDQYIILNRPGTSQFFISALADATNYSPLDFASTESETDNLLGVLVSHREVWLFGERSIEIWANTGASPFPFERISGATIQRGAASKFSFANLDNSVFWLGEDGVVYRANGYQPVRISTRPIEQAIGNETLSEASAIAYQKGGHSFFVLTFPNGKTWIYDASSGAWHRRKSFGIERWRGNVYVFAYGRHLIGDFQSGKLWELKDDVYTEGTDPLVSERKTQYLSDSVSNWHRMSELEIIFNTGVGLTTGQGSVPMVDLRYSDDGGNTFTNFRQASLGAKGQYGKRVRFHGLGRAIQRVFHVRVSDPVRRDLISSEAVIV